MISRITYAVAAAVMAMELSGAAVQAQEFPTKTIRIIVASSPGTTNDIIARVLAPPMAKVLGQPVVVENKTGASDRVGYEYVATQTPADGYTIAVISLNALVSLPLTTKDLNFDPIKDLPAFMIATESRLDLGVSPKSGFKTFEEFVAAAKANPGKLNYGSSSSTTRILTEIILKKRGLNVVYVPFSTTAANLSALVAGEVQVGIHPETNLLGADVAILAQSGPARSMHVSYAPTFIELGIPELRGGTAALHARRGTPKPIIDKLFAVADQVLKQPDVRSQLEKAQQDIVDGSTPDSAVRVQTELSDVFSAAAKQIGITPQ